MKGHGQTNRYQYGWSDTYTFSDPNGTDVLTLFGGILTESYYAVTGKESDFGNLKGALYDGYNGTSWDATKSAIGDCLNFCTLGVGTVGVNSLKLAFSEAKVFIAGSKFILPEMSLIGRGAESSYQSAQLSKFYGQYEKYSTKGIGLQNGRYRIYGELMPSKKTGEMVGARLVKEFNPATGSSRAWYETLDQAGRVRSVAPKPVVESLNHRIFDISGKYVGRR